METYKILADYLTVEGLLELRDGWTMAYPDGNAHIDEINKALEYLGWENA